MIRAHRQQESPLRTPSTETMSSIRSDAPPAACRSRSRGTSLAAAVLRSVAPDERHGEKVCKYIADRRYANRRAHLGKASGQSDGLATVSVGRSSGRQFDDRTRPAGARLPGIATQRAFDGGEARVGHYRETNEREHAPQLTSRLQRAGRRDALRRPVLLLSSLRSHLGHHLGTVAPPVRRPHGCARIALTTQTRCHDASSIRSPDICSTA